MIGGYRMNIVVLGAGSIGGYIGGRLIEAGLSTTFLVREKRAEKLRETGLRIKSVHGDYSSKEIKVYTDVESITACDVVIVAVKGYQLQNVLPKLKVLVKNGAKVLPFLNGMEHIQILSNELGTKNVLGGLVFTFSTLNENESIVQTSDLHDFIIGALHPSQKEFCNQLVQIMKPAKLNVYKSDHILYELWKKYMFINALSGITTASRLPVGLLREVPETLNLYKKILKEMQLLSKAYDMNLHENEIEVFMKQINELSKENTSSMHQDLQKGLPIEIEHLHGGALRMAKDKNILLPITQSIYALLKPYEEGPPPKTWP